MSEEYYDPADVARLRDGEPPALVIDVRSPEEFAASHIPGARHIPHDRLEAELENLPDDRPLIPY